MLSASQETRKEFYRVSSLRLLRIQFRFAFQVFHMHPNQYMCSNVNSYTYASTKNDVFYKLYKLLIYLLHVFKKPWKHL